MAAVSPLIPPPWAKAEEAVKSANIREAQAIIFLLRFIVYHFNVRYTKYVLKTCANQGFYAGGKPRQRGSVNPCFFGVNIALLSSPRPLTGSDVQSFSTVSHYLSVLRAVLSKSLRHVLIIYRSGNSWVITPGLVVDFGADCGDPFAGGNLVELFTNCPVEGQSEAGGRRSRRGSSTRE